MGGSEALKGTKLESDIVGAEGVRLAGQSQMAASTAAAIAPPPTTICPIRGGMRWKGAARLANTVAPTP